MAKKLTKAKAKEILHDKSVHGKPLTDKQRKFFGAVASGYIKAQNGIEGTMGGLTDIGFDYNGAWGGTMQMGGSLPGATGMMYARIGAPSNGKYAKKTKPSAQNGMEMKYWQEGLDFKPKTISENGSWLEKYQDGGTKKGIKLLSLDELKKVANEIPKSKQDATAVRSATKPVSNSKSSVEKALMAQRANTKAQEEFKKAEEKYKYYNPEVKDIEVADPQLNFLYKNQWLIDVPILGDYIKSKAKEIAISSGGQPAVNISDIKGGSYKQGASQDYVGFNTGDRNLPTMVDQYFSEEPLYAKSIYKPSSDYLEFLPSYSLKGDYDKKLTKDPNLSQSFKTSIDDILLKKGDVDEVYKNFLSTKRPVYEQYDTESSLSYLLDTNLGGHKVGLNWDKEKNLPYISISDAWDFEPTHYAKKWAETTGMEDYAKQAYVQASLLHKAGNPFKVYDRFYFDPKTKEYISDQKVAQRKKFDDGGVIEDPMGQWAHPGEITRIPSNEITMQGVPYPVLGISDTGDMQMMQPGEDYTFDGNSVTEIPMMQKGGQVKDPGYSEPDYVTGTSRRALNKMIGMGNYLLPANVLNQAADFAKAKGLDYGANTSGPADAVRHAASAASTAARLPIPKLISQYSPALDRAMRIAATNALGLGYELRNFNTEGLLMDLKNNYKGSLVGSIPGLSDKERNKMIVNQLTNKQLIVDNPKRKKENGGWLSKYE
jgi:hypothetical protein